MHVPAGLMYLDTIQVQDDEIMRYVTNTDCFQRYRYRKQLAKKLPREYRRAALDYLIARHIAWYQQDNSRLQRHVHKYGQSRMLGCVDGE